MEKTAQFVTKYFSLIVATGGTAVTTLVGGSDLMLHVLLYFMAFDYLTGFLAAWRNKEINSEVMWWGAIRKVVILGVVAACYHLDLLFGFSSLVLRTYAVYYYISREGISNWENIGKLGLNLPPFLFQVFQQVQDKAAAALAAAGLKTTDDQNK